MNTTNKIEKHIEIIKDYINSKIEEYKFEVSLEEYHFTMEDHQQSLRHSILKYGKCFEDYENSNSTNLIKLYDEQFINKLINECFNKNIDLHLLNINEVLQILNSIKSPEQRSIEWFDQRRNLISASDAKKACGNPSSKYYKELILKKLGYELPMLHSDATIHGTIYEVVSQRIYETRNGVFITEYGCIPHSTYSFIGASPDGIINSINQNHPNDELSKKSLIGRMIEIKNPFSREITNQIKDEYVYQIQLQLEVCNLSICDFLECNIRSAIMTYNKFEKTRTYKPIYNSITEFLDDCLTPEKLTKPINLGIPICNHSKDGKERGVLLEFIKLSVGGSSQYKSMLYPIDIPYTFEGIETWKETIVEEMNIIGFMLNKVHFWKLFEFDIKTVERDLTYWNETLKPGLIKFWERVENCRNMTPDEKIVYFGDLLELVSMDDETIIETPQPMETSQPIEVPKQELIRKRKNKPDNYMIELDPSSQYKFSDE
jgi:hypothetical protein